jgi:hypothetical protein
MRVVVGFFLAAAWGVVMGLLVSNLSLIGGFLIAKLMVPASEINNTEDKK